MVADAQLSECAPGGFLQQHPDRPRPRFTACEHTGHLALENLLLPGAPVLLVVGVCSRRQACTCTRGTGRLPFRLAPFGVSGPEAPGRVGIRRHHTRSGPGRRASRGRLPGRRRLFQHAGQLAQLDTR